MAKMNTKQPQQIADEISPLIKGECFADIFTRVAFSTDASIYQIIPVCVVAPAGVEDVSAVVKYACRNDIAIAPRGAGSGLGGESLTAGIMLDMTRFMNKIIGISADGGTAVCQPGVVLDELNNRLLKFGRGIGPDPSSGDRAVIGGVVANNSTGAHSLSYGYIAEYVEKLQAVLADGTIAEFVNDTDPAKVLAGLTDDRSITVAALQQNIIKQCFELLNSNAELIAKSQPATRRSHSGYNIAGVVRNNKIDMAKMLAGSEGTLAVFTEITLRTVAIPKASAVVQLEFDSLDKMARAVPLIVDCGASACELMGGDLIKIARDAFEQYRDILNPSSVASLLAEYTGDTDEEVKQKIERAVSAVEGFVFDKQIVFDPDVQKRLFNCRKDAVPLLSRRKGLKQPIPFIEDVSVDNKKLAEYLAALQKIGERHEVEMVYYGHAGDGEVHVRPLLDLSDPADVKKMTEIAEEVFTLALSLGGALSGEHADGLIHAAFMKKHFGEEYYEILKKLKRIFDPKNSLNPDKIISDRADIMVCDLRGKNKILEGRTKTELNFRPDEFKFELVQCNGCGVCRSMVSSVRMCPVFCATGDEMYSSRARANLLAAWAKGILTEKDFESEQFKEILSACLNCKACAIECPSGVDVSKMIMEVRARLAKKKGLGKTAQVLTHNRYIGILNSLFAPISNFVLSLWPMKWFMDALLGIDKRRRMPRFGFSSFVKKANKYLAKQSKLENPVDKVAYFTDTFVNYNDHELGFAAVKFLRANNIEVVVPAQRPAPLPAVVYGDIKTSRKDLQYNVENLAKAVKRGYKIICSEPSAALCLKEDLRFFVDSDDARCVSENTFEFFEYLKNLINQKKLDSRFRGNDEILRCAQNDEILRCAQNDEILRCAQNDNPAKVLAGLTKPPASAFAKGLRTDRQVRGLTDRYVHHTPCHLFALERQPATMEVLKKLAGIEAEELDGGCCGIAGTFGMQKKNYDLSMKIGRRLAEKIEESNADVILTECSTCKMQIEHTTGRKVEHPIKVLAKVYGLIGN